jgi:hypothetical protein
MTSGRVLILGLGDLGQRIALGLVRGRASELVLVGRDASASAGLARLVGACGTVPVRHGAVDALALTSLRGLLERERPDLVVQCASLLSPWAVFERATEAAQVVRTAGFGLQLCAHLPVVHNVMRAVRASALPCPVVNCSYPDVTNAVLAAQGLAPSTGIGNAGMVLSLAAPVLAGVRHPRLFAHHAHVGPAAQATAAVDIPPPRLFDSDTELDGAALLSCGASIPMTRALNALSATHAVDVVNAMLPGAAPWTTSAPGPLGLPGGWPVRIHAGSIELDLPPGINIADMLPYQHACARADGIEAIGEDGSVHFTSRLRAGLPARWRKLAEPLVPDQALERHAMLTAMLAALS